MNKVIFIVLLSLSTCFSFPSEPEADKPNSALKFGDNKTALKPELIKNETVPIIITTPHAEPAHEQAVKTIATTPADPKEAKTPSTDSKATLPPTKATEPQKANTTATTDSDNKEKKPEPAKIDDKKEQKVVPSNTTVQTTIKPEQKNVTTEQTTPKPTVAPKTTEAPKPTDKADAKLQARSFDGASFVGGMILTLGLLAVGFIGFRYYRAQNAERNYHTL